ncbi:MAG: hypothetical protein IPG53_12050 [Ignavibacteriales bacterium]|nr:hypothetical protein [Ignavibacteriales bacterium]
MVEGGYAIEINSSFNDNLWRENLGGRLDGLYYKSDTLTDIKEPDVRPMEFSLKQNYPNPFNPSTVILFNIPEENSVSGVTGNVVMDVYNSTGEKVATLLNQSMEPGNHQVTFDASGNAGWSLFYELKYGEYRVVKKMVLIRSESSWGGYPHEDWFKLSRRLKAFRLYVKSQHKILFKNLCCFYFDVDISCCSYKAIVLIENIKRHPILVLRHYSPKNLTPIPAFQRL